MILKPDLDAGYDDPFAATRMLVIFCDIDEPSTGEGYARDPRTTAKRAEAYVASTGIGDTVYVGPEAEFFMFDDVRFETGYNKSGFEIDDIELPTNTGRAYEGGNLRSEEHTSELQSPMRISYAVFCLKKKKQH